MIIITEAYIIFDVDISTLKGGPLKLVDKFTYLGSRVSSTKKNINLWPAKAWTDIDRLSVIWKSDLTDKIKHRFYEAVVMSILLFGCTTWMVTKRMEKKLDSNYTRMLEAILNKSWKQHSTRQQLYSHLPPIKKTIQVRPTRYVEHSWRNRNKLMTYSCGPLRIDEQRQDDQQEPTHNTSVPIQDVALKTNRKWWTIEKGGRRGAGISMLVAQHHHDNDIIFR